MTGNKKMSSKKE